MVYYRVALWGRSAVLWYYHGCRSWFGVSKSVIKVKSIGVSDRDMKKLEEIKNKEQIQSKSEVIRRAIDLYWRETCKNK